MGLRDAARPTAPGAPRQLRPGVGGQAAARVVRVARPVDGLRAHAHARLAQVRRRCVRGPTQPQALIDRSGQHRIIRQLGGPNASRPRACRRVRRAGVIARPPGATGQLAMHRGPITAQPLRYVRDAAARPQRRLDEHPLIQTQPRCHTGHLHRSVACVGNGHHDRSLATTDGVRRCSPGLDPLAPCDSGFVRHCCFDLPLGVFQDQVVEQSAHTCLCASSGEERTAAGSSPVSALTCGNTPQKRLRRTFVHPRNESPRVA